MPYPMPIASAPSWYAYPDHNAQNAKANIYYKGESPVPQITLNQAGPTSYEVRDCSGNVVSSGSMSGTICTPTAPVGGWKCGCYFVLFFAAPNTDSLYGASAGFTMFNVVPRSKNLPSLSSVSPSNKGSAEGLTDIPVKAALGGGLPYRLYVNHAETPNAPSDNNGLGELVNAVSDMTTYITPWWLAPDDESRDWRRSRRPVMQFVRNAVDRIDLAGTSGGTIWLKMYAKDNTIDGTNLFVSQGPGTTGSKVSVFYPNSSTLVETWDNLASSAAAITAINAGSAYIRVFRGDGANVASTLAPTVLGNARKVGITQVVQALCAVGCFNFEMMNEPALFGTHLEIAFALGQFRAICQAADSRAKANGPVQVGLEAKISEDQGFLLWLADGGGANADENDQHLYNGLVNADLNHSRATLQKWVDGLEQYGQDTKPRWITESTHTFLTLAPNVNTSSATFHPRRSRVPLQQTILCEQYGVPHEQNLVWYDRSHGFWGYAAFWQTGDWTVLPYMTMYRTLTDETWGKLFHHAVDFASEPANRIFLGNVYEGRDHSQTMVMLTTSAMPNSSVTLTVTGMTAPLTVVDAWGNTSTVSISSGRYTIPVSEIPTYVRLPAGAAATVYSVNDWGTNAPGSISSLASSAIVGSTPTKTIIDDAYMGDYSLTPSVPGIYKSAGSLPENVTLTWSQSVTAERCIVVCGPAYKELSTLTDFDVQVSADGTTGWTTVHTTTKTDNTSVLHGAAGSVSHGAQRHTWWDEQWIFDCKFSSAQTFKGLRLVVRGTSYGGEPDATCGALTNGNQGSSTAYITLQEIIVPSATVFTYADHSALMLGKSPNGYWKFEETTPWTTGGTAASEVNNSTMVATGFNKDGRDPVRNLSGGPIAASASGLFQISSTALLNVGDVFTLIWWGTTNTAVGSQPFYVRANNWGFAKGMGTGTNDRLVFFTATSGSAVGTVMAYSTTSYPFASGGNPSPSNHQFAVTKNGSAIHIYADGVDVTDAATLNNVTLSSVAGPGQLGSPYAYNDEIALLPTALSAAEIAADYAAGSKPHPATNTRQPRMKGTGSVGEQIGYDPGRWSVAGNSVFQVQESADGITGWADIAAAVGPYLIPAAKVGSYLRYVETRRNLIGDTTQSASAAVGPVASPTRHAGRGRI